MTSGDSVFVFETDEHKMIPGLNPEKFDSNWRRMCDVAPAGPSMIRHMVAAHYLHCWPAIQVLKLGMFCGPWIVGMVIYSLPPRETAVRYGGTTWELARLWIRDEIPRNAESWLIAQSIQYVRRNYPEVGWLISYADPAHGHTGTIYKASNWRYDGMTDQERKTPRCDYMDLRTGKSYGRKGNVPDSAIIQRVPRGSKHRFIYQLAA